jgi:hypothetical protein
MSTPTKKREEIDDVPPAPRKIYNSETVMELTPKKIDFAKSEETIAHCMVFEKNLFKHHMNFIAPIEMYQDLIVDDDYNPSKKKPTKLICAITEYYRHHNLFTKDDGKFFDSLVSLHQNINYISERAASLCPDNEEIKWMIEMINHFKPIVDKIVHFTKIEKNTGIPTCMSSGKPIKSIYYKKYLKYKKKYLELKKK